MKKHIDDIIRIALEEDIQGGDITTDILVPKNHKSKAHIVVKEPAVLCGIEIAKKIFKKLDKNTKIVTDYKDGQQVRKGEIIATISGNTRALLTGERTVLNFLGYFSGIATTTRKYVVAVKPYKAQILDTRKTAPGLRLLKKYAVRCGGGTSHRLNLNDMVLIKDNHRDACNPHISIEDSIKLTKKHTKKLVEIEVDTLSQLKEALMADPDMILLDNMSVKQLKQAVQITDKLKLKHRPLLEASGGVNLQTVRNIAATGVDRISIGSLTHTIKTIDMSMELID